MVDESRDLSEVEGLEEFIQSKLWSKMLQNVFSRSILQHSKIRHSISTTCACSNNTVGLRWGTGNGTLENCTSEYGR